MCNNIVLYISAITIPYELDVQNDIYLGSCKNNENNGDIKIIDLIKPQA